MREDVNPASHNQQQDRVQIPTATQLLRNGVDIVTVADIMGHARIDTVRLYTRSSEADRARAIETTLITDE